MKNWIKKNRILVISTLAMLLFMGIGWMLYALFGHRIIETIYKGESVGFLNRIIEGQETYPLEFYFIHADMEFKRVCLFGLIAIICIFLFGLWVHHITKRKIIITTLAFFGLLVFNAMRINLPSIENSAKRLLKKTEILAKIAQTFNEKKALMELGMNNINGFYYRFDEHIKEAICKNKSFDKAKVQKDLEGFSSEFNSNEVQKFKPKKGKFTLEGGLLKLKYIKDDYLQSIGDLNIAAYSIGAIELRIKLKKGERIVLGGSIDGSAECGRDWRKIGSITIKTIPDNRFHIYRIDVKNVLGRYLGYGNSIKRGFLFPSNVPDDEVEIDYIRFIKREEYEALYGETYETIDKEMRKALYINTPLCLKYALDIPEGKPFLKFGMGILKENDPVKFRVVVKCENTQKEVFSREIINNNKWHDARIDFSEWSGKSVEISLETESSKENIAFWSNPIIYTPPKKRFNVIIILEDALRADHMSCYGYSRKTTPVKDKFIRSGVLFLNAFSQAPKTRPSCSSIMTSLYPSATGVWDLPEMLDDKYLTLAEIMRSQGFVTASFIQNNNAGSYAGLHQGFSNSFAAGILGSRAEEIYGKKLYEWIEANIDRNLFLYLHLVDPHAPYDPPRPFDTWCREAPSGEIFGWKDRSLDPEWVETPTLEGRRLLYDGEIRYNDFYFERFLEKLRDYKLLNDTLIVFIADHGEHLGEHNLWQHHPPGYVQVLHVPLLMVHPKNYQRM